MAQDKSYGSGKPVSANDSRSRARVAAGRMTKGKKRAVDNLVSKAGGFADFIVNGPKETRGKYAELGVSSLKLASVAKALFSAGKVEAGNIVRARVNAKNIGKANPFRESVSYGRQDSLLRQAKVKRMYSTELFPKTTRAVKTGAQALNERKSKLASKRQSDNWLKGK